MNIENAISCIFEISIVTEGVYTRMLEVWIQRQPVLWPLQPRIIALSPRFDKTTAESMYKNRSTECIGDKYNSRNPSGPLVSYGGHSHDGNGARID